MKIKVQFFADSGICHSTESTTTVCPTQPPSGGRSVKV